MPEYLFEPLGPTHDRAAFSCGNDVLDDFLKTKARRENDLGFCAVFVMVRADSPSAIAGYYTLSAYSILVEGIDAQARKRFLKYPLVPTVLLGRLARDLSIKGRNAGSQLLIDALRRAQLSATQAGSYAVVVDAIDDRAADFYRRFSFLPVVGWSRRFYLPMTTIRQLDL